MADSGTKQTWYDHGTMGNPRSAEVAPSAKKKRKMRENEVLRKVATFIPESKLYARLKDFENRMDSSLARRRGEVQEAAKNPMRSPAILRLYVFNSHAHQEENGGGDPPSWTLFLYGKVLRPRKNEEGQEQIEENEDNDEPKLSQLLRRVQVQLDENLYPGEKGRVVWESGSGKEVDCFEIKRTGSAEVKVKVTVHLDQVPPKFELSQPLARLLGVKADTKPNVIAALWQYIKKNRCQLRNEPHTINCDENLKQVFGNEEKIEFSKLASKLQEHLLPEPPVSFDYTVKVGGTSPTSPDVYDLQIDAPTSAEAYEEFIANSNKDKTIEQCEKEIAVLANRVGEHKRRRAFFLGFSHSPVDFINSLIASQARDLKVLKSSDAQGQAILGGRTEFYKLPWAQDAVVKYLQRRLAAGAIES